MAGRLWWPALWALAACAPGAGPPARPPDGACARRGAPPRAPARRPSPGPAEAAEAGGAAEPVLLLQTGLALGASAGRPGAAAAPGGAKGTSAACGPASAFPLQFQILRLLGRKPHDGPCMELPERPLALAATVHGAQGPTVLPAAAYVTLTYLAAALAILGHTAWGIFRPEETCRHRPERPEAAAWKSGFVTWLSISWAAPWIRWCRGPTTPGKTSISVLDLGKPCDEGDEAKLASEALKRMWRDDVACRGSSGVNLYNAIVRFCTVRKLVGLCLITALYQVLLYLGSALAVEWTLGCMARLREERPLGSAPAGPEDGLRPALAVIGLFTGLPLLLALCGTASSLASGRLSQRLQAALVSAILRKAQRLPCAAGRGHDLGPPDERAAARGGAAEGRRHGLARLVAGGGALADAPAALARSAAALPVLAALAALLAARLGRALLPAAGLALGGALLAAPAACAQAVRLAWFQATAGARLSFLQEALRGIRAVKCHGWEPAATAIASDIRAKELGHLAWYFLWYGLLLLLTLSCPRMVIICAQSSYVSTFKRMSASDVFVMVQYLNAFKGAVQLVFSQLPQLLAVWSSMRRIDQFLKLPEVPNCSPRTGCDAGWLSLWPREAGPHGAPVLRIQGSFARGPGLAPALHGLDVQVGRGELVAVVGEAGAGKSTLLQALLGELTPVGDARLEVPAEMAYHAQAPHLCEATLKENVLYWADCDDERYAHAILAAGLMAELEALPGGDSAYLGACGVGLTASQGARVSLARVAYSPGTEVCLLDEPFAAVDGPTRRHLAKHLLQGPLLSARTRIVACEAQALHLAPFDRVLVLRDGRVAAQGAPSEVSGSPELRALLRGGPEASEGAGAPRPVGPERAAAAARAAAEEPDGWPEWPAARCFCELGGRRCAVACGLLLAAYALCAQLGDVVLARWADEAAALQAAGRAVQGGQRRALGCLFWTALSAGCFAGSWAFGAVFTLSVSRGLHERLLARLMRAPLDYFYDRTPVGLIMSRLASDMPELDLKMYLKFLATLGQLLTFAVPMLYVHMVMPLYFALSCIPFYLLLAVLLKSYWRTMAQLRCLIGAARSRIGMHMTQVEHSIVTMRAYRLTDALSAQQMLAVDHMLQADFALSSARRWVINRLLVMCSVLCTCVALLGVLPGRPIPIPIGDAGLSLSSVVLVLVAVEAYLDTASCAQFGLAPMRRLRGLLAAEQEREALLDSDAWFSSPAVDLARAALGGLELRGAQRGPEVLRGGRVLLEPSADGRALVAPPGRELAALEPGSEALRRAAAWHRVAAANLAAGDARRIAEELCRGRSPRVVLTLRSGWLADGARVVVTDLVAGYADLPASVLRGLSLTVERGRRVAVVGARGCGKTTLLLCFLRALEPRSGKIKVEGVDIQSLGLQTLRRSIGFVPQDPVLFTGTMRSNTDPLGDYTDEQLWRALQLVELEAPVSRLATGLDSMVRADGEPLSFGQRRLLCLARAALGRPALLLLDEAPAAEPGAEAALRRAARRALPEATLLAAAARLPEAAAADFDLVAVLDGGRVVERGAPAELGAARGGLLAKLAAAGGPR